MVKEKDEAPPAEPVITIDAVSLINGVVRIHGRSYDLLKMDGLGLRARSTLNRHWKRISALEELDPDSVTPEDETEYEDRLRAIAPLIVPSAPSATLAKLSTDELVDLAAAFFARGVMNSRRLPMLRSLIGATSSPSSSGATAATSKAGSTSR